MVTKTVAQHTAGPWRLDPDDMGLVLDADGAPIQTAGPHAIDDTTADGSGYANARLIAAAPDLLAALRECLEVTAAAMRVITQIDIGTLVGAPAETRNQAFVDEVKVIGITNGFGVRAKAAIAKAEGAEC